ncbi:hypothetical protein OUZ56_014700 [Daphnia magna]|uniref:Uncharacterized protein n=1 Tax=Daphnia magna TaxID=35525 RepID=A0ABR0AKS0_9CRUS|nr:hypothetical protein OUZ56_014700 [Daphnia magna]
MQIFTDYTRASLMGRFAINSLKGGIVPIKPPLTGWRMALAGLTWAVGKWVVKKGTFSSCVHRHLTRDTTEGIEPVMKAQPLPLVYWLRSTQDYHDHMLLFFRRCRTASTNRDGVGQSARVQCAMDCH